MTLTPTLPARSRAQLTADSVRVIRSGTVVLDGVDLTVSPGSRIGIVGENGRGKSTLLHALAGSLATDAGTVTRMGTLGLAEQEMPTADGRTVGDVIELELHSAHRACEELDAAAAALVDATDASAARYDAALSAAETLDAWDADRRVDTALAALSATTDRSRKLATLSVGQRYRVRLASLLGAQHDFLLLDEPTNHLDAEGLAFLTNALLRHPGGLVVVTHDRALLGDVATTIVDLDPSRDGRPRVYGGGLEGYRAGRAAERERWVAEYEAQVQEHARLADDLSAAQNRLSTGWRPDKGTGKHQRQSRAPGIVQAVNRRREALERHAITAPVPPQRFRMPELSARPGVTLLQAENVTVTRRLRSPASLIVDSGSRHVITGPNGAGKSTLLRLLAGDLDPTTGSVRRARTARIALLKQEAPMTGTRRAQEVYESRVARLVTAGVLNDSAAPSLASLGLLDAADRSKSVSSLSMGRRRRLALALALVSRPHALLLDEPTNHLSMTLVDELTEALRATEAAVVVATHDRQLLRDLADWPVTPIASHG